MTKRENGYQRVVSRIPVGFQPDAKKAPKQILCYVIETLECGHEKTVHPSDREPLTARSRVCHQCSGWFGALRLPRKPVRAKKLKDA